MTCSVQNLDLVHAARSLSMVSKGLSAFVLAVPCLVSCVTAIGVSSHLPVDGSDPQRGGGVDAAGEEGVNEGAAVEELNIVKGVATFQLSCSAGRS